MQAEPTHVVPKKGGNVNVVAQLRNADAEKSGYGLCKDAGDFVVDKEEALGNGTLGFAYI